MYALIYQGSTLSYVTPLISSRFDVFPEILHEPILVSTPIGDDIIVEREHKNFPIHFLDRVTHGDLVEFAMLDFYLILGMYFLYKCYATIDCRNRVVRFLFSNELESE